MDDTLNIDLQKYEDTMQLEPVQIFTSKNKQFIITSSNFFRLSLKICKFGSFPPAQNLLDEFNKLYTIIVPIAKGVIQSIKGLMPVNR